MEQVIIGGYYNLLNVAATEFTILASGYGWVVNPDDRGQVVSTSGSIKNLRIKLDGMPGTGTYTFTLYRRVGLGAWADTALTCTVAADGTVASDVVNEVAVAAGDVIALKCVPNSPDNAVNAAWTIMFEGDTVKESLLLCHSYAQLANSVYAKPMGYSVNVAVENSERSVCPADGVIKDLYVQLADDFGTTPEAYRFVLRVNGVDSDDGGGNALECTITADDIIGNDTAHEIVVSIGDILTIQIEPLNAPTLSKHAAIGMTFVADIDGESIILGGSPGDLDDTDTRYHFLLPPAGTAWTVTETQRYQLAQECTLKKFYMLLSDSPGADTDYTFTVRQGGVSPDGGLVVEIADAATTGNDTTNTITISDDDYVGLMVVPTGTPTTRDAYWGLVCHVAVRATIKPPLATISAEGIAPTLYLELLRAMVAVTNRKVMNVFTNLREWINHTGIRS